MTDPNEDELFDDGPEPINSDAFDDDEELEILDAENRDEVMKQDVRLFKFPAEPGKKRAGFFVRHATLNRVNRYQNAHKAGSNRQKLQAACELIADSVVDSAGQVVWKASDLKSMASGRVDRFLFIQQCVSEHNGMTDSSATMQEIIDEAEGN